VFISAINGVHWNNLDAASAIRTESRGRIVHSSFQRFNLEWKTRTLNLFTQAA
jgi:hypothetical protein